MNKKTGKCGCGTVEFSINADVISIINCHCTMCREHNGTAFTSYVIIPSESLEIVKGEKHISRYKKDNSNKHFCNECGTPLFNAHDKYEKIRLVYLGAINNSAVLTPNVNVWCENQLKWIPEIGNIKNIEQGS